MAIREGRWDCPSCGSRAVYGRHVDCPGCGKPRPKGIRFYLTDDAPAITDAAQLAEAKAGPDWICGQCDATNRATRQTCGGCGCVREIAEVQPVREYAPGQEPRSGSSPAARPLAAPRSSGAKWKGWVVGGVVAAWIVAAVIDELPARERPLELVPATVEGMAWEHDVVIEERRIVPDSGRTLPDSALDVSSRQVVDGYRKEVARYLTRTRQVPRVNLVVTGYTTEWTTVSKEVPSGTSSYTCGQRDLGNGYFEDITCTETEYETVTRRERVRVPVTRADTTYETVVEREPVYHDVPVYGTVYRYRRVEWVPVDTVSAAADTAAPAWPAVPQAPGRRAGPRLSRYTVNARTADGTLRQVWVSGETWPPYRRGQPIAISADGGVSLAYPADSLPACRRWHRGRGDPPPASLGCSPRPR